MKIVIIGGVAAGAGAAARFRRLDEKGKIVLLEKGSAISYANCGLPYHLGSVIPERDSLLVFSPEKFRSWFHADVRTGNEALSIDRAGKTVEIRRVADGSTYFETYDKLLIATGSAPREMEIPGTDEAGENRVFRFWTLGDMDKLDSVLRAGAKRVVIAGAGFVGLELAENLRERKLEVTLVQRSEHLLSFLDPEMSSYVAAELKRLGIGLMTGNEIERFEKSEGDFPLKIRLSGGGSLDADFVVLTVGVMPNSALGRSCGLQLGRKGHILTDEFMRTEDPDIYAAGDVAEVVHSVSGAHFAFPLAGLANKQGRVAADNMAGGHSVFHGAEGSSVLKIGRLTVAGAGKTSRVLSAGKTPFRRIYTHPSSHAGYYPGAEKLHMKLIVSPDCKKILGIQIVGGLSGTEKRLDTVVSAMACGMSAPGLADLELAYAPPYSSAKDPVNYLGMIADDIASGLTEQVCPDEIPRDAFLLDAREPEEFEIGTIPGSVNIPLGELRGKIDTLDRSRRIVVFCQVGLRGYLAERILKQNGFPVSNLSGGYLAWKSFQSRNWNFSAAFSPAKETHELQLPSFPEDCEELDVRALACPGPVIRLKHAADALPDGKAIHLLAPLSFEGDLRSWASGVGFHVEITEGKKEYLEAFVRKSPMKSICFSAENSIESSGSCSIVLFSGDLDKAMAALIIACGMASSGAKTGIFFTFWGLSVLRKKPAPPVKKDFLSSVFGKMLPCGAEELKLSKMNMAGLGTKMMKDVMARKNVSTLSELIYQARALGVRFIACEMAMDVMGVTRDELIPEVDEVAGVASFVAMSKGGRTLFI